MQNTGQDLISINTSSESDWRINDRQPHLIKYDQNTVSIPSGSYLIIANNPEIFLQDHPQVVAPVLKSAIQLTNSAGTIKISNDQGKTYFEEVTYSSSLGGKGNGRSLEKDDSGWYESQVVGGTPGNQNSDRVTISVSADSQPVIDNQPETIQPVTIKQVQNLSEGETTSVIGIVTAPPNILSTKTFYIQDDSGGIQIYASKTPDLILGDRVKVVGKRSQYNLEKRLTAQKNGLELLGENTDPTVQKIQIQNINSELVGSLVTVAGKINIDKGDLGITDDEGSGLAMVIRESTGIKRPSWHDGDWVEVTGILSLYKAQLRILPRYQSDISWRIPEDTDQSMTVSTEPKTEASNQPSTTIGQENIKLDQPLPEEKPDTGPSANRKTNASRALDKSHNITSPETVKGQIKGLLTVNDTPAPVAVDQQAAESRQTQPKSPRPSGLAVIYGIVLGGLVVLLWEKRFIVQKIRPTLLNWVKNWPKLLNRKQ